MTYYIVRISDKVVVESNLPKEEALKQLFFYDTTEEPHEMICEQEHHLYES